MLYIGPAEAARAAGLKSEQCRDVRPTPIGQTMTLRSISALTIFRELVSAMPQTLVGQNLEGPAAKVMRQVHAQADSATSRARRAT